MIDAVHDGAARRRVRRRRRLREALRRLPPEGHRARRSSPPRPRCAPAATSRAGSSPAAARTPTRSRVQGIECVNLANGTERNHEPTERVSVAALEGMLDVCLALLDEAAARHDAAMSSRFERLEARTVFEGAIVDVCEGDVPPRGRRGGHAPVGRAPRRGRRSSPTTASTSGSCASRARRPATPTCSSCPRASSTRRGRRRWSARGASWPRRSARPREHWEHLTTLLHLGRLHRRAVPHLPRHRPARRRPATRSRASGSTSSRARSPSSTPRSRECRDAKTLIGLLLLRDRCAPQAERRVARGRAAPPRRRSGPRPMAIATPPASHPAVRAPAARLPRLPGVRARAVAQHARGLPLRPAPVRRVARAHAATTRSPSATPS